MAYDSAKAHEYYEKYKKKGLKKGRKRGRKKTTSSKTKKQSLLGLSTSGLNDAGKMNWAIAKKDLQDQMNAEIAKATTDEQKAEIRSDYQNRALKTLQDMKKDPSFAQAKSSKSGKSSESSNKSGSKSGSKSSGSAANKSSKSKRSKTAAAKSTTSAKAVSHGSASTAARTVSNEEFTKIKEMSEQIEELKTRLAAMSIEQKAKVRDSVRLMIDKLKKVKKNG